jgi:hypothetical protein
LFYRTDITLAKMVNVFDENYKSVRPGIAIASDRVTSYIKFEDMKTIFSHYFDFPADFWEDAEIKEALTTFCGRPICFVKYFFGHVYNRFTVGDLLNADFTINREMLHAIEERKLEVIRLVRTDLGKLYDHPSPPLPWPNSHRTYDMLVPALVKGILCGNGKLFLDNTTVNQAIRHGVIPVKGVINNEGNRKYIALPEVESITFSTLKTFLTERAEKDSKLFFDCLVSGCMNGNDGSAEEVVAYFLALQVAGSKDKKLSLYHLFKPLFDYSLEEARPPVPDSSGGIL